jgi:hypothetical protein
MTTEPASPPDIIIKSVSVVQPVVTAGSPFDIDVTVFAPDEDFEDGVAYRLYCFVCSCAGNPPAQVPEPVKGHVQDSPWKDATSTIRFTGIAGSAPAIYDVKAVLLEGPSGVPDPDDPPSVFCTDCSGGIVVVEKPAYTK